MQRLQSNATFSVQHRCLTDVNYACRKSDDVRRRKLRLFASAQTMGIPKDLNSLIRCEYSSKLKHENIYQ